MQENNTAGFQFTSRFEFYATGLDKKTVVNFMAHEQQREREREIEKISLDNAVKANNICVCGRLIKYD
jgi:hypothetical protein